MVFIGLILFIIAFFGGLLLVSKSETEQLNEISKAAELIGAVAPEIDFTNRTLETFSSFVVLNRGVRRTVRWLVTYPSDFGEVYLFYFRCYRRPKYTPTPHSSCHSTILLCGENFGLPPNLLSNGFSSIVKRLLFRQKVDKQLLATIETEKRLCEVEISDSGILWHLPGYIFSPDDLPDLFGKFETILTQIENVRSQNIKTPYQNQP